MPWKLILFVLCLVIFAVFSVANAGNTCDISFIFAKYENVQIVIALVVSFTLGVLVTLPFVVIGRSKAAKKSSAQKPADAKLSHAEKKAAKKNGAGFEASDDASVDETLGQKSPRGKISLR
jgi:uncharacterized integral membrane protein